MTEIVAAHLERVAKQTAKLCAEDVNTINFNRGHVLHNIRGEYDHVMPTEEMAKVIEWRVAAALAACAREARNEGIEAVCGLVAAQGDELFFGPFSIGRNPKRVQQEHTMLVELIRALKRERAVGEKAKP